MSPMQRGFSYHREKQHSVIKHQCSLYILFRFNDNSLIRGKYDDNSYRNQYTL